MLYSKMCFGVKETGRATVDKLMVPTYS